MQIKGMRCVCSVPCERVMYEPSLSYFQLSTFNVKKLLLPDPGSQTRVLDKFVKARETAQRVIPDIVSEDLKMIGRVTNVSSFYLPHLLDSCWKLKIYSDAKQQSLLTAYEQTSNFLQTSFLDYLYTRKFNKKRIFDGRIQRSFISITNYQNNIIDFLQFEGESVLSIWNDCIIKNVSFSINNSETVCNDTIVGTKVYQLRLVSEKLLINTSAVFESVDAMYTSYISTTSHLFRNTSLNITGYPKHINCLKYFTAMNLTIVSALENITKYVEYYLDSELPDTKLYTAGRISAASILMDEFNIDRTIRICGWFDYKNTGVSYVYNTFVTPLVPVSNLVSETRSLLASVGNFADLTVQQLLDAEVILDALQLYLNNSTNITKSALHDLVSDVRTSQITSAILSYHSSISSLISQLSKDLKSIYNILSVINDAMFTFDDLPIMDDALINTMPIIKYSRNLENIEIEKHLSLLPFDREKYFKTITAELFNLFYNETMTMTSTLLSFGTDFVTAMEKLKTGLQQYHDGNQIDHTFFM